MKIIPPFAAALALLAPAALHAQDEPAVAVPVPAYVTQTSSSGGSQTLLRYIVDSSATSIRIVDSPNSSSIRDVLLSDVGGAVYLPEPPEYAAGIQAYISGNLEEAATLFEACARLYFHTEKLPNNYSSLGRFYYAQCMRQLGNWDRLETVIEPLNIELLPEGFRAQASLFPMWRAYGAEAWDRVLRIDGQLEYSDLYPAIQAQANYLAACAHEANGDLTLARIGYNGAFTLNYHSDPIMAKLAADRLIAIYLADSEFKEAMEEDKAGELQSNDPRRRKLEEAASVVYLYPQVLSDGEDPPAGSDVFLNYLSLPGSGGDPPAAEDIDKGDADEEGETDQAPADEEGAGEGE